ncbi:MAG: radical SAM family heme chaperone HemW [Firmicutes bacterium]|nr:radical SAM family heme chaperone HemW [Oscillospiraceae bacterium]MBR0416784.1 radical SAM family heme chaperone HemW [Bacillota bacterium]
MKKGLYIHIPFCKRKCRYCDFYSLPCRGRVPDAYIDRVLEEIARYGDNTFDTIYLGGGTPSLLSAGQVNRILSSVRYVEDAEITLEANPDSLTKENLEGYRKAGVNRLSIGVQSVSDTQLRILGRLHDRNGAERAFRLAREAGFENINGDVMLGLSNYTKKEMTDTIDFLIDNGVTHISAYMLKVEEGTPFYDDPPENLSNEEELSEFYLEACSYLESIGFRQYEISNFARDGMVSRHNMIYWKMDDYLGIGPAAYSCWNGKRFHYDRDLDSFMRDPHVIHDGTVDVDEYIMLSLRLSDGLDLTELKKKWGYALNDRTTREMYLLNDQGLLKFDGNRIALTPQGFLVENSISSEIMRNIYPI